MSVFGPVTDEDRRIWQIRAHTTLGKILADAHRTDLPPIQWAIHGDLTLMGRIEGICRTADAARGAFERWAEFLQADQRLERADSFLVHLIAARPPGEDGITVRLVCDISLVPGDEP